MYHNKQSLALLVDKEALTSPLFQGILEHFVQANEDLKQDNELKLDWPVGRLEGEIEDLEVEIRFNEMYIDKLESSVLKLVESVLSLNPSSGELGEGRCLNIQEQANEIKAMVGG